MSENMTVDEIILGFVKWAQQRGRNMDACSYEEIEQEIDKYMRSRVAGG